MSRILVGIDGSVRGERALAWAMDRARRDGATLELAAVVDPAVVREAGSDAATMRAASEAALEAAKNTVAERCPGIEIVTEILEGGIVESLVDASSDCDMVVVGSHHGSTIGEAIGGAKGLRISVSVPVPTVVIPADWDPEAQGEGIVCGVGPDKVSERAVAFAAKEALADGQPLELVSAWGLPPVLTRPAEVLGGGLAPVGEQFQRDLDARVAALTAEQPDLKVTGRAVEGSSPAQTLVKCSEGHRMLVLGTHSRTALGRALFGSVTHGALLNLSVPTVVVPQA